MLWRVRHLRPYHAQLGECWPAVGASSSVAREGSFVNAVLGILAMPSGERPHWTNVGEAPTVFATGGGPGRHARSISKRSWRPGGPIFGGSEEPVLPDWFLGGDCLRN